MAAAAYRAVASRDAAALREVAELAAALPSSRERRLETNVQGDAFAKAIDTGWPNAAMAFLRAEAGEPIPLPIAVGAAAAGEGLELEATLVAFLTSFVANLAGWPGTIGRPRCRPCGDVDD
jgi:urease accessory protein